MKRFLNGLDRAMMGTADGICITSLFLMLSLVMVVVIGRYFFNYTPAWSEELALFFMTWVGLFSSSVAEHEKTHIRLSFLDRFYPRKLRRILGVFRYYVKIGFFAMMTYYGIQLFMTTKQKYGAIPFSYKWAFLPGVLTGVFCLIFLLLRIRSEMTDRYDVVKEDLFE